MAKTSNGSKPLRKKSPTPIESAARRPQTAVAAAFKGDGNLEEQIRQRAYELYEQDGRQEGRDQEYWFRAEAEIRGRRSA